VPTARNVSGTCPNGWLICVSPNFLIEPKAIFPGALQMCRLVADQSTAIQQTAVTAVRKAGYSRWMATGINMAP